CATTSPLARLREVLRYDTVPTAAQARVVSARECGQHPSAWSRRLKRREVVPSYVPATWVHTSGTGGGPWTTFEFPQNLGFKSSVSLLLTMVSAMPFGTGGAVPGHLVNDVLVAEILPGSNPCFQRVSKLRRNRTELHIVGPTKT